MGVTIENFIKIKYKDGKIYKNISYQSMLVSNTYDCAEGPEVAARRRGQ